MEARNGLVQTQEQDITLTDAGSDAGSVKQQGEGGDEEVAPAKDSSSDNGSTDDSSASDGSTGTEGKICDGEEKNPWTKPYIGIPVNYFSVGVILGGSVSVLYPILIIQNNVTSSFYAAAASLVTVFWSYKILFGILCDCFPFRGLKWRPYIVSGWALCALMMALLALMGNGISPINLVIMLTFANFGYVVADVGKFSHQLTILSASEKNNLFPTPFTHEDIRFAFEHLNAKSNINSCRRIHGLDGSSRETRTPRQNSNPHLHYPIRG